MVVSYPVLSPLQIRRSLAVVLLITVSSAHALERVNLRTGFSYDCAAHEALDADHVRLYFSTNPTNFQDIPSELIASIEILPDLPIAQPALAALPAPPLAIDVHTLLALAGAQHNIDVELLASVIKAESGGNAHAVSRTGARGLMQLMPGTAQQLGVQDSFQPDQNIAGGVAYLDTLLTHYRNNLELALAAYNAGPAAVARYHGIPPYRETIAYIARVENEFIRRKHTLHAAAAATLATR